MSQTIEELYFEFLPTNLFRHGNASSPQLNKPRTMPPREKIKFTMSKFI